MNRNRFNVFFRHGLFSCVVALWLLLLSPTLLAKLLHHELLIELDRDTASVSVSDTITFPEGINKLTFRLNSQFEITDNNVNVRLLSSSPGRQVHYYQLSRLSEDRKVQLQYRGKITKDARSGLFGMPNRVFDEKMLYLDGSSHWYPVFPEHPRFTFSLETNIPEDWEIISQGKSTRSDNRISYQMPHAQDDIYLIGAPWKRYVKLANGIEMEVFLLKENQPLAQRYLEATKRYIELYSNWVGAYPYKKFAVIENRWQTGYGMPSFTLLGSHVIRLPFILYTSLPHEILHNWWGNGVFIDFSEGNWSEGLTAYMADHFNSAQRQQDDEYRRKALERYANFAARQNDFALKDFTSRHNEASQSIGYSKSLMVFHMLRNMLGEDVFNLKIQSFWEEFKFSPASFVELISWILEGTSHDAQHFITQWLYRVGAPEITFDDALVEKVENKYRLTINLQQQQDDDAYQLVIPMKVTFENGDTTTEQLVFTEKSLRTSFVYGYKPASIQVDPDYDVFRLLHPQEKPASLGRLFGSEKQLLVYPADSTPAQLTAWKELAMHWQGKYNNVTIISDKELDSIPTETAIWILGWNNQLLNTYGDRLSSATQRLQDNTVVVDSNNYTDSSHAIILLDNDTRRQPLGFIGAEDASTIKRLGRKLTHYNSYGRLVFDGSSVQNLVKQHLKAGNSPLIKTFTSNGLDESNE